MPGHFRVESVLGDHGNVRKQPELAGRNNQVFEATHVTHGTIANLDLVPAANGCLKTDGATMASALYFHSVAQTQGTSVLNTACNSPHLYWIH